MENGKRFSNLNFENMAENQCSLVIGNLNKSDTRKTITVQDPFVQELLEIWSEVNFCKHIKMKQQFLEQPIWHNSLIRIEDKPAFNK